MFWVAALGGTRVQLPPLRAIDGRTPLSVEGLCANVAHEAGGVSQMQLSQEVERVLSIANSEAGVLHHAFVAPEHLLLGLLGESALMRRLLNAAGAEVDAVRADVLGAMTTGATKEPMKDRPYTAWTKKILELAAESADQDGAGSLEIRHVVVGLLRFGRGTAANTVTALGITERSVTELASEP